MGKFHRNFLFFSPPFLLDKKEAGRRAAFGPGKIAGPDYVCRSSLREDAPLGRAARAIEKIESAKKTLDNDWVVCYHAIMVS